MSSASMESPSPRLYFAFGSNLWLEQMSLRCPGSTLAGIGRLRGYKWFINARGYANIAPSPRDNHDDDNDHANQVWGLIYRLTPTDEARLDRNEGVPHAYEKHTLPVDFWPSVTPLHPGPSPLPPSSPPSQKPTPTTNPTRRPPLAAPMLTYIDRKRTTTAHLPRAEYVHRMNAGIRDALRLGMPGGYVDAVLRAYIPASAAGEGEGIGDAEVAALVARQAAEFREEDGSAGGGGHSEYVSVADAGGGGDDGKVRRGVGEVGLGSGVVSAAEEEEGSEDRRAGGDGDPEEEDLPERASEVCYMKHYML